MARLDLEDRRAVLAAMATSAAMLAYQVGGRAIRDALFLSEFPITTLSALIVVSALISAAVALPWSRLLWKHGPERLVTRALAGSAVSLLGIWALSRVAPRPAAIVLYLDIVVLGPVIASGFWLLISERFDARIAKRTIGRLGAAGTLGGVAGGLLSHEVAQWAGPYAMLPVLAGIHLLCVSLVRGVSQGADPAVRARWSDSEAPGGLLAGVRAILARPYLRHVGTAVALGAAGAALLEYVLKAEVAAARLDSREMVRLFAFFHSGVAVLAFLLQFMVSSRVLRAYGPARTAATQPLSVLAGGTLAALLPGLPSMLAVRSAEMVLRGSLFRSGYQLLFTPIPVGERRSTKSIIDIALDRIGEAAGGGLTALLVLLAGQGAPRAMLWTATAIGFAGTVLTLRIHREYVRTLERQLEEEPEEVHPAFGDAFALDATTIPSPTSTAEESRAPASALESPASLITPRLDLPPSAGRRPRVLGDELVTMAIDRASLGLGPAARGPEPSASDGTMAAIRRAEDLLSGDAARIHAALADPLPASLVPHVIPLAGRDDVARAAVGALRDVAPTVVGQLTDAVLDADLAIDARRRIARLLGLVGSPRAIEGLMAGLDDPRFAVRHACGLALAGFRERSPDTRFDTDRVFTQVYREVDVEARVWQGNHDIKRLDQPSAIHTYLEHRASASLEHVFNLLALVLAQQPLRSAWRHLNGADRSQRGLALDYLENVLPPPIRERLWQFLEEDPGKPPTRRSVREIVAELQEQHPSMRFKLSDLQKPE